MKNLLTFAAIALFFPLTLPAQSGPDSTRLETPLPATFPESVKQLDSTLSYHYYDRADSVVTSRQINLYNPSGKEVLQLDDNWDSVGNMWMHYSKSEWDFDEAGHMTLQAFYYWDSQKNSWVGFPSYETCAKNEWTYDNQGRLTYDAGFEWDTTSEGWKPRYEQTNEYDLAGPESVTIILFQNWSSEGWLDGHRTEKTVDSTGLQVTEILSDWDLDLQDWVLVGKRETRFDADGNILLKENYNWNEDPGEYWIDSRYETRFDEDNRLISELTWRWDSKTDEPSMGSKTDYTRDSAGNVVFMASCKWLAAEKKWDAYHHSVESSFNDQGNLLSRITSDWNTSRNELVPIFREDHAWDPQQNQVLFTEYGWNAMDSIWQPVDRMAWHYLRGSLVDTLTTSYWISESTGWILNGQSRYGYDSADRKTCEQGFFRDHFSETWSATFKYDYLYDEDGDLTCQVYNLWDGELDDYRLISKLFNYYRTSLGISHDNLTGKLLVYPNPARDVIRLSGWDEPVEIRIYSVKGQLVQYNQQVRDQMDISRLAPGVYLLVIRGDQSGTFRTRLVRE